MVFIMDSSVSRCPQYPLLRDGALPPGGAVSSVIEGYPRVRPLHDELREVHVDDLVAVERHERLLMASISSTGPVVSITRIALLSSATQNSHRTHPFLTSSGNRIDGERRGRNRTSRCQPSHRLWSAHEGELETLVHNGAHAPPRSGRIRRHQLFDTRTRKVLQFLSRLPKG